MDITDLMEQCDALIRSGRGSECDAILRKIKITQIPRMKLATYCSLARRSGSVDISLRALRPFVRPNQAGEKASPFEIVEYSKGLMKVGAFREADELLSDPRFTADKEAILARAFLAVYQWNYESALDQFRLYLMQPQLDEYASLMARVNELSCLNFLGSSQFLDRFRSLSEDLGKSSNFLLHANILEISAQFLIAEGSWVEAGLALEQARELVPHTRDRNFRLIEKWQSILKALRSRSFSDLEKFREYALENQDWETLRSLDYYHTQMNPENPWAERVYFGTPYESFRKKLERIRPYPEETWIGTGKNNFDPWFPGLQEGNLMHRLMIVGLGDLYRPLSGTELFSTLHQDEHFHIDSVDSRVRQSILRTRTWIKKCNAPLKLNFDRGYYSLRTTPEARILFRKSKISLKPQNFLFGRYVSIQTVGWTTKEWAARLGMSQESAAKLLNKAARDGFLEKTQSGRIHLYLAKTAP